MFRIAAYAEERAEYCLERGVECDGSPFLYVADSERAGPQARVLLALAEPVERAAGDERAARIVLDGLRDAVEGRDPDDVIAGLHAAYGRSSRWLAGENRGRSGRRVFLGLTCIVRAATDLFIAQVPPGQTLIRQDRMVYAFPALRSWSPTFQPSRTYELPNPLGFREICEPQVYYSRAEAGDLLAVVSSSIAARLAPLEDELRDAANVDDLIETVADVCDRHGVFSGVAGFARV